MMLNYTVLILPTKFIPQAENVIIYIVFLASEYCVILIII